VLFYQKKHSVFFGLALYYCNSKIFILISNMSQEFKNINSYKKFWPHKKNLVPAPLLPMSRAEMDNLDWDSCDIIIITGDAYVDHPSFGMAIIGRLLESQGFRVGIISQPNWHNTDDFKKLGKPNLFFAVASGNMDSMVNHYTADKKPRSDDAYTAGGVAGKRPDRATTVYTQRAKESFKGVPVIIGGIEASLRRIAQYDHWSQTVRRSILPDSKADLLLFGNAERAVVEVAHRVAAGENIKKIRDVRGTAFMEQEIIGDWTILDSSKIDSEKSLKHPVKNPYEDTSKSSPCDDKKQENEVKNEIKNQSIPQIIDFVARPKNLNREKTIIKLPSFEEVKTDRYLYAHTSRVFHLETNPGNARAMVQKHGNRYVWLNPPPIPLETDEFDSVFELPYTRKPHTSYGEKIIPAFDMIRHSINIMRGCFGGCTFCSITEHEGRIIQSRSEDSVLREIETIRDTDESFKGNISDLGGPTANMYHLKCKDEKIEKSCRRLSCVYPGICPNLGTDHKPLTKLYKRARGLKGIKKIFISSGLRYDLAVRDPEYIKELVTHHVSGRLKIAPEHTEEDTLSKMMKPGIGSYHRFKKLFDRYSAQAGKEQYLIPYFISSHPGTSDEDMLNLALWLKDNNFKPDQVQAFMPTPMAIASAMYHTELNPLKKITRNGEEVKTPKSGKQRVLHKAFLRYHDPKNWDILRQGLKNMGRSDLIGSGENCLVPYSNTGNQSNSRNARKTTNDFHHRIKKPSKTLKKKFKKS
jgi:uncharacterized radical SAM protein YgiQ